MPSIIPESVYQSIWMQQGGSQSGPVRIYDMRCQRLHGQMLTGVRWSWMLPGSPQGRTAPTAVGGSLICPRNRLGCGTCKALWRGKQEWTSVRTHAITLPTTANKDAAATALISVHFQGRVRAPHVGSGRRAPSKHDQRSSSHCTIEVPASLKMQSDIH